MHCCAPVASRKGTKFFVNFLDVSQSDCEGYVQSSLDETRALAVALKIQIAPQADDDRSNFSR